YAVARAGQASPTLAEPGKDLRPLFEAILSHIPPPPAPLEGDDTLRLLVANLDYDDYLGRLAIGRVHSGRIYPGEPRGMARAGGGVERGKVARPDGCSGVKREESSDAGPGELVSVAGIQQVSIGDTLTDPENPQALPRISVDEPTMMMIFRVNDGPLAGRE